MNNLLAPHWKYTLPESAVPANLLGWLLHSGSFMQRLEERGINNSRIQVISQKWQCAESWENKLLNLNVTTESLVREVLILNETNYWMFARSVFPRQLLTGEESELADLKTRSLGSVLFSRPNMIRGEFAYTCLYPGSLWHRKVMDNISGIVHSAYAELWARYSLFHLQEKSLLLTEVFLPDVAEL